jgi:hypothetical protein
MGVDFSFNGLKYYVSCTDKIIKYEKERHDKGTDYEKIKEVSVPGIQNLKCIENGDLAVHVLSEGKNMFTFYSHNLIKLSSFDIRGSDGIHEGKLFPNYRSNPLLFEKKANFY